MQGEKSKSFERIQPEEIENLMEMTEMWEEYVLKILKKWKVCIINAIQTKVPPIT